MSVGNEESVCCAIRLHIAVFFQQKIIFALKTLECHKGTGRITIKSGPFSSRMPMISLRSAMNAAAQSKTMTGLGPNPQVKYGRTPCDCNMICCIFHFLHPYCPSRTLRSLGTSLLTVARLSLETFGKKSLFLDQLSGTHYHYPSEKPSVLQLLERNIRLIFFIFICVKCKC